MRQQILPKEQWAEYEEDTFYLELCLKERLFRKERERERKKEREWAKK